MAKYKDPKVRVAKPYSGVKRVMRNPAHPFKLRTKPYQIQPCMISPVLPGETMKNLVHMSRVVTKPIKDPLVGWWYENYVFYVRLRDIEFHLKDTKGEWLNEMVTSPGTFDPTPLRSATALQAFYSSANSIPWAKYAMETIVEYYFRDQDEDWDVATLDNLPLAQLGSRNWMDSLTLNDDKRTDRDYDLDVNNDGNITAQEAIEGMEHWQALRDAGLESLDYEDWVRTFGVSIPERTDEQSSFNDHRPELLRYYRQWQYPTNTVEPTNGVPSSAVSWINAFRADKDRFFKEPGFIVGLTVCKPKAYLKDPTGALAGFLDHVENWLPAISHAHYEKGFKSFAANAGPLASKIGVSPFEAYWVDLRDLYIYGDQFVNYALDGSAVSTITASGGNRYPKAADIDALFTGADKYIQHDGIYNLTIAGRQQDRTRGPVL